ncbi:MAG TPA: murein biosynthesis protein MurJ [Candidatus Corynebacterium avicola]|uniref:Murein biosynthesis protein MurJ n=1 Tax=Candidatus Corynebacterium avicola TaxID=2838527 RepID=A0A9D1UL85_9CORY|nr:murein biosynthesis protein MurJ [Candidatus Corynebacterium avicola]
MNDSQETSEGSGQSGERGRFRASTPPAKVPAPKKAAPGQQAGTGTGSAGSEDYSHLDKSPAERAATNPRLRATGPDAALVTAGAGAGAAGAAAAGAEGSDAASGADGTEGTEGNEGSAVTKASDKDVVGATGSMAIATLLSRITGFLRTVFIAAALGTHVASAFNTANTLPNLITELVLGAVLTSLVVPLLVRAEKEDPDRGEAFIRRLLTITFTLMMTVTVIAVLAAPLLTELSLGGDSKVNVGMATAFAYLVLPQIVFYAMFAVMMAVLNTKGVFKPGAWAPVVNNCVTLLVLSLYILLPDDMQLSPNDSVTITDAKIMLLGLGTTLGVVVQAAIMVPYLRKAGINLRPLWGLDDRLKKFGGMALAIVVYVLISQAGWLVNNRIAGEADPGAPTIYMNAWQLLQVPYGVIGVTLLTAVMPRLSRNAADGDDKAVVKDLTMASKLTMLALVPVITFFTAFGTLIAPALFALGQFSLDDANILGWTVSFSAFTLIPYALVLLHLRVFYAREEVWTPTFIIGGITVTKLALASAAPFIASETRLVVVLLGAANGMGFVAGAIIGHRLLKRSLGHLGMKSVAKTSLWALGASIISALVVWRIDALIDRFFIPDGFRPGFVIRLLITGVLFLAIVMFLMSFTKLPEVRMIGASLARLPGVGRFFARSAAAEAETETGPGRRARITEMDLTSISGMNGMTGAMAQDFAGGAMPPLSAGQVRGPRLVPGAPILHGRFRLLSDHGGSPTARFWQARDNESGDLVALTILDPQLARTSARELLERTDTLARVNSPAVAAIREICDARTLVVVVSDWTDGAPLTRVADSGPDPLAAGFALADLADAAGAAADIDGSLGIDHRNRLRISSEGRAVLAFPGVLPNGTPRQDLHAIRVSLDLLLSSVDPAEVPESLRAIAEDTQNGGDAGDIDGHTLAKRLREATTTDLDADLVTTVDVAPNPEQRAGFGAAPEKAGRTALSAGITIGGIFLVVALAVVAVAFFGGDRRDSPVTTDSIRGGAGASSSAEAPANQTPEEIDPLWAAEWAPADAGTGTLDNPDEAPLILDGDTGTTWKSAEYFAQLGDGPESLKPGIGLLLQLPDTTTVTEVQLDGLTEGTRIEMRLAPRGGDLNSLDQAALLDAQTASGETMTLSQDVGDDASNVASGDRVLLWITELPMPDAASVGEASVTGIQENADAENATDATDAADAGTGAEE